LFRFQNKLPLQILVFKGDEILFVFSGDSREGAAGCPFSRKGSLDLGSRCSENGNYSAPAGSLNHGSLAGWPLPRFSPSPAFRRPTPRPPPAPPGDRTEQLLIPSAGAEYGKPAPGFSTFPRAYWITIYLLLRAISQQTTIRGQYLYAAFCTITVMRDEFPSIQPAGFNKDSIVAIHSAGFKTRKYLIDIDIPEGTIFYGADFENSPRFRCCLLPDRQKNRLFSESLIFGMSRLVGRAPNNPAICVQILAENKDIQE